MLARSRKKVLGSIPCCRTTRVPYSWPWEGMRQWPRLRHQVHAQPLSSALPPCCTALHVHCCVLQLTVHPTPTQYCLLANSAAMRYKDRMSNDFCITTQARDMAEYLGVDPDSESDLMDIARMAVAAPTPPGWQQIDNPDGSGVFRS